MQLTALILATFFVSGCAVVLSAFHYDAGYAYWWVTAFPAMVTHLWAGRELKLLEESKCDLID